MAGPEEHVLAFARRSRWRPAEYALWIAIAGCGLLFPDHLLLASQILIAGLFALSLDLLLGYGGMVSLGHAAFFGIGAYTAGLLSQHGWTEPVSGLVAATLAAGLLGYLTSFVIVRLSGVALLMVTLGFGLLLFQLGNTLSAITGGSDGMTGITIAPLLGQFEFDFYGRTGFWYALIVTFAMFALVRRIVNSPFGLSLQGYRENPARMAQIGAPMAARLRLLNTLAGGLAGLAGGLLVQTTQFAGLDDLAFQRSAEVLVMLILGGGGRLYGGLVGAALFMIGRNVLSAATPQYWYFWLGAMLVAIVLFMPSGLMGGGAALIAWMRRRRSAM